MPLHINIMPVQWRNDMVFIYPVPAFGMPVPEILVTAIIYKFQVFNVGYQSRTYFKSIQVNLMPIKLVIKTKAVPLKPDLVNAFFHIMNALPVSSSVLGKIYSLE